MQNIKKIFFELNKITSKLSLRNYCKFWNLVFILSLKSLRFTGIENQKILVSDNKSEIFISQKLRGYFYFKSIRNRFESLGNMYFFGMINFEKDDIIIDCGANIGEIYNSVKLFSKNEFNYYGFEPVKSEYDLLKLNSVNNIERPLALFNKSENLKLYVHKEGADSTLIEDSRYSEFDNVESIRLDDIKALENKKIKLLKLEAEGAELEVLLGCGDLLKNVQFISADLGFELDQGTKSNEKEVTDYLLKNKFSKLASNSRHINLFINKRFEKQISTIG